MEKINLTIDGKKISAAPSSSILKAALENDISIPHLCADEKLSPWGACRLCVVEIEGQKGLWASCVTEVKENMVVKTFSPKILETRKMLLELMLANHPLECHICERNGACLLQDYAYLYGVKGDKFEGERRRIPVETDNPFIIRDMEKCILCGKCIRVCDEIQINNAIDFANRGFKTKVAAFMDLSLKASGDCVFCGNCIEVCPVGALTERPSVGKGRAWEVKKTRTVCPFCGVGCNIEVSTKDEKVVRVEGYEHPHINDGWLCVKGRFGYDFVESPERITTPLIRDGEKGQGRFRKASWEEALDYTAQKLKEIRDQYTPRALGALSSARCTNEDNYIMQKFMRAVVGTNNVDHCART
jgi:formate dehydrogenase alpha subunit